MENGKEEIYGKLRIGGGKMWVKGNWEMKRKRSNGSYELEENCMRMGSGK